MEYELVRARIKNIYIKIIDGKVVVRAPKRISVSEIDTLVASKEKWIKEALSKQEKRNDRHIDLRTRNYIYILGKKKEIKYIERDVKRVNVDIKEDYIEVIVPKGKIDYDLVEKHLDKKLKEIAVVEIERAINKYLKLTGLTINSLSVRKFKSIWGNCSSKKDIKINQNVIWFTRKEIEYVCLHEICHLKYMNHQKGFWNMVEKYMPDYKNSIKAMKE